MTSIGDVIQRLRTSGVDDDGYTSKSVRLRSHIPNSGKEQRTGKHSQPISGIPHALSMNKIGKWLTFSTNRVMVSISEPTKTKRHLCL